MLAIPLCQQVYNCKKKFLKFITKKEASVSEDLLHDQSCLNSLGNNGFKPTLYVWRAKMPVSIFVNSQKVEFADLVVNRTDASALPAGIVASDSLSQGESFSVALIGDS